MLGPGRGGTAPATEFDCHEDKGIHGWEESVRADGFERIAAFGFVLGCAFTINF